MLTAVFKLKFGKNNQLKEEKQNERNLQSIKGQIFKRNHLL